jgi:hypothetical protein
VVKISISWRNFQKSQSTTELSTCTGASETLGHAGTTRGKPGSVERRLCGNSESVSTAPACVRTTDVAVQNHGEMCPDPTTGLCPNLGVWCPDCPVACKGFWAVWCPDKNLSFIGIFGGPTSTHAVLNSVQYRRYESENHADL